MANGFGSEMHFKINMQLTANANEKQTNWQKTLVHFERPRRKQKKNWHYYFSFASQMLVVKHISTSDISKFW